jgi:hypothetical protein
MELEMSWFKCWKLSNPDPEPTPMTPEEREAIREAELAIQAAKKEIKSAEEFILWLMKAPRPVLEAWRDQAAEREKRK